MPRALSWVLRIPRKEGRNDDTGKLHLVEEVSDTYFTSIAQKITEDKFAVKSYLPVQQKQVPVRLQDSHVWHDLGSANATAGRRSERTNVLHHTRQSKLPHCKHPSENGIRFVTKEEQDQTPCVWKDNFRSC
jgi:hypothetical protein